jgi:multidrug resistance efflux pump
MSGVELKANDVKTLAGIKRRSVLSSVRVVPVLATAVVVALAVALGWQAWQYYMGAPWTRDGTVRAYVVKVAPQVAGQIVQLPIADNQFVHKGDLLMLIDPRNYSIAVRQAEAAVEQARATSENANAEMTRRLKLSDIAVTMEERQTYVSQAATAEATYQSALANLDQARVNLRRTEVRSPVNGYITNLSAQLGDYADVGALQLSVVNSDSYWVDAYFEETALGRIQEGDAATIKLMGYSPLLRGRVQGLARGINVPNAAPDASGLASVNPIFTFVRLAQRVPVRIHVDEVPEGVTLVAGLTATVEIEPYQAPSSSGSKPSSAHVSEAAPQPVPLETLADASPQSAPPQAALSQAARQAMPSAPPSKAPGQPVSQVAQPQAVAQAPQSESVARSAAPETSADELAVSAPSSAQASAAADAASADLKTLEEQIAANPPSGAGSQAATPSSENLGQTIDLYDGQSVQPAPALRSPVSLHRRARPRWRHGYGHQYGPRAPSPWLQVESGGR